MAAGCSGGGGSNSPNYKREGWLRKKYLQEGLSSREVADEAGCSKTTICKYLGKYDIDVRGRNPPPDGAKYADRGWMKKKYVERGASINDIADELGCGEGTVQSWLAKHGIETRSVSNHIELSPDLCEVFDGFLLGDGSMDMPYKGARYQHGDKHIEFIGWLDSLMEEFGVDRGGDVTYSSGVYRWRSKYIIELTNVYSKWYPDGERKIPDDFELTPTKLLLWYIGDGSYLNQHEPTIYCEGHIGDLSPVMTQLRDVGIEATVMSRAIYVGSESRGTFFDYVLSSPYRPNGYEYKFPEDRDYGDGVADPKAFDRGGKSS
jgi:DNA-binding CsgD family transcriptional regulator